MRIDSVGDGMKGLGMGLQAMRWREESALEEDVALVYMVFSSSTLLARRK